jgi:hypothetical protein
LRMISSEKSATFRDRALVDRFNETNRIMKFDPTDLILRSRAKHGVSKDGRRHDLACGRPSRRAQERAPQDEV